MKNPVSIMIFPDKNGNATGDLYYDDGKSFAYKNGEYNYINFHLEKYSVIGISSSGMFGDKKYSTRWDDIYIFGFDNSKMKLDNITLVFVSVVDTIEKEVKEISLKFKQEEDMLTIYVKDLSLSIGEHKELKLFLKQIE